MYCMYKMLILMATQNIDCILLHLTLVFIYIIDLDGKYLSPVKYVN